jgi:tetratricopeptide (TPR) repeat protein
VFGLLVFLSLFLAKTPAEGEGKNRRKFVGTLFGGTFLAGIYPAIQIQILQPLADPQNPSVLFRRQLWSGVWKMIVDHPFFGTGFGTFPALYPAYRPISLMMSQTQRSYEVNDAHNWVLSWLSQTGWVGLALLLAFWAVVFYQWWKLYQGSAIPPALGAGAFAAFTGLGLDNLFDLNSGLPSTLVPLLFLAALPVALSQRFYRLPGYPIQARETRLEGFRVPWLVLALLVSALAFFQFRTAFGKQWADVQLKKAVQFSEMKQWKEAFQAYDKSLQLDPRNVVAHYFRGSAYGARAEAGDDEKALDDLNHVSDLEPDYVLNHFKKAIVLEKLGRAQDAAEEMKRAIALDPRLAFQLPSYHEARDKAGKRDFKGALVIYQRLVFDYPTCVPALVDEANCLFLLGRQAEAEAAYREALQLDPDNPEAKQNLQQLFQVRNH